MSAAVANSEIAKFTTLESKLRGIDCSLSATGDVEAERELTLARTAMLDHIHDCGFDRYEVGMAVLRYHAFYGLEQTRAWRDEAGPAIMSALGFKSLKSLYNLTNDADLANQLTELRREAFVALGIDPASAKYAGLVTTLLPAPPSESPQSAEAEVTAAHAKFLADRKQRTEERRSLAGDPQDFRRRIADRLTMNIVSFTNHVHGQDRVAVLNDISGLVLAQLAGEVAESHANLPTADDVAKSNAGPVPVPANSQNRPSKNAAAHEAATAKPTLVSPKAATKSFYASGPAHPWGDACLNSLRIVGARPNGAQQLEFNRERLYEVRDDQSPKRFLVDDVPDLFNVESDDVILEHLSVFRQATTHVFQILTKNLERARQIKFDMKASGLTFPFNVWVGTTIECYQDLGRIEDLAELNLETSWVSFSDYSSNSNHPLSTSVLASMPKSCLPRWIVGRVDIECSGPDFSLEDALYLTREAWGDVNYPIFFAQPRTKAAFVSGQDVASPFTDEPEIAELLKMREFPFEGFQLQRPSEIKKFPPFAGQPVELIGYRSSKA